ncbi:MAG: hypothetical protein VX501_09665 [Pseudomonadota bacterium]|nr:hypothetical protein [Pseudomonadota bacterium]
MPLSDTLRQYSRRRLASCHVDLRRVVMQAEAWMPFDVMVLEGARSVARQQRLFARGRSQTTGQWQIVDWDKVVTCHDGLDEPGKHVSQPAQAVTLAPWPLDLADRDRFLVMAGVVLAAASSLGISVRWGGEWCGPAPEDRPELVFFDLAHFQLNRMTY